MSNDKNCSKMPRYSHFIILWEIEHTFRSQGSRLYRDQDPGLRFLKNWILIWVFQIWGLYEQAISISRGLYRNLCMTKLENPWTKRKRKNTRSTCSYNFLVSNSWQSLGDFQWTSVKHTTEILFLPSFAVTECLFECFCGLVVSNASFNINITIAGL